VTYGLSYAFIVSTERAFASDLVKKRLGTALGTFHTLISIVALPASLIAGALWQYVSPATTFLFAALVADIAAILFILNKKIKI
jgi:MFS-type transporter involved in bile tolerance (Atg22 family)